jgi:NAD(P)-dependent dehydrogenase (short-subunit alcohol dehydrogenase family)
MADPMTGDRKTKRMSGMLIVTGGGRGIGAATARLAAARGWDVCVNYRADADAAAAVVDGCRTLSVRAVAVRADIAVEADVVGLFDSAERELGPVRGLVNSAGVVAAYSRLADMSADRIERMVAVNLIGTMLCCREAIRRMSSANGAVGGAIVNVSSRAAVLGSPGEYVDYAAAKAGVDSVTCGLAREVAAEGIRVNAVRPGLVRTDIHAATGEPLRLDRLRPTIPMQREAEPDEIAEAVLWLLSPAASYVSGAVLDVSGAR